MNFIDVLVDDKYYGQVVWSLRSEYIQLLKEKNIIKESDEPMYRLHLESLKK